MLMSKVIGATFISLLILFFQVSSAFALQAKDTNPPKNALKKSSLKSRSSAAPVRQATSGREKRSTRVHNRSRPVTAKSKTSSRHQAVRSSQKLQGKSIRKSAREIRTDRAAHRVKDASGITPSDSSAGDRAGVNAATDPIGLDSNAAFILDKRSARALFAKNPDVALPIASITKLMTGLVVVGARQNMNEMLEVTEHDIDRERYTISKLAVGTRLRRAEMLHLALMSSENRAASVLGRNYPGGLPAFVVAMNAKARALGMSNARFVDPTGLSSRNVASARDLAKLVIAAHKHPRIARYTTHRKHAVNTGKRIHRYANSNHLVRNADWNIELQKTGYIREAGRCLVMQVKVNNRSVVMVLLDSKTPRARISDAKRMREWIRGVKGAPAAMLSKSAGAQN